jgi:uncharacterized protein (DUF433 family)
MAQSRISRRKDIQGGAYCIRGTRIQCWVIKGAARDWDTATIMREYPGLTAEDVAAALAFRQKEPHPPTTAPQVGAAKALDIDPRTERPYCAGSLAVTRLVELALEGLGKPADKGGEG